MGNTAWYGMVNPPPLESGRYLEDRHFALYVKTLPIEAFANWLDRMKDFGYGIVSENLK